MNGFLRASRLTRGVTYFLFLVAIVTSFALDTNAQRAEFRAFWVDTFNTSLNTPEQVSAVVAQAKATNANALLLQVRRRGDAWYLNTIEPVTTEVAIQPGFDPLQDVIDKAHAEGIEVHAFVIMSAIYSRHPRILGLPQNPNHPFNLHGGYNATTDRIDPGPNNWLTRTLIPDGTAAVTYQGHRIGNDFWVDFGHPDAAAYTVDVLTHLVRNYDIDGLHLDRIRYPEISITGQTPTTGANIGYNSTSVERFQRHQGIPVGSAPPSPGNAAWAQWRREQVTNVVRRVYLNTIAIKPHVKVSAALIAFGGAPTCAAGANCKAIWESSAAAEAYWRVYQDWRSWTEEGILDIAVPMNYKREHISAQATQFNSWNEWTKNNQYNRSAMIGLGNFINSNEGTIRQVRRSLAPSLQGNSVNGVAFFSLATSNVYSNSGSPAANPTAVPNPFSVPANQLTPTRSFAEFAAGLTTGKSVNGATLYEPDVNDPGYQAIFATKASIPMLPWKVAPVVGHIMGFARRSNSSPLDTAAVTITNIGTETSRNGATDGGGFYGGVDLTPGQYLVRAVLGQDVVYSCVANVSAGAVTTADLAVENTAPSTSATLSPAAPNGANGWYVSDVQLNLAASDSCTGVERTEYSIDGGQSWVPYSGTVTLDQEGIFTVLYRSIDRAGNIETAGSLEVKIDKTAPTAELSASPDEIWPPNGQLFDVTLNGTGADAVSGLSQISYTVTDEYGMTFTVDPRSLNGNTAAWADVLKAEAARRGDDLDGRLYTVTATVTDVAGHTVTVTEEIVVVHDQRKE